VSHYLSLVFSSPSVEALAVIAGKTAVVFFVLIAGLRLLGKRELGQMNLYDLVLIVVLGNSVQNAMINGDNTLVGGIVSAATLLVLAFGLNRIVSRSRRAEGLLVGEPSVIVADGRMITARMKREGINQDQLFAALREHGIEGLHGVRLAVLEADGTISVIPTSLTVPRTRRHYRGLRLP
jgi:uncharacterized membrane protein YcaP (DUF421 family)